MQDQQYAFSSEYCSWVRIRRDRH